MKKVSRTPRNFVKMLIILGLFFCYSSKTEAVLKNPFEPQVPKKESEIKEVISPVKEVPKPVKGQTSDLSRKIEKEVPLPKLTVTGVIWNSKRPQAIINQNVVDVGDDIEGVKIMGIRKTAIDVLFQGREITIEP